MCALRVPYTHVKPDPDMTPIFGVADAQRSSQPFTRACFGEFLFAYDRQLWDGATVGTFLRYTVLGARTSGDTVVQSNPFALDETVRLNFQQRAWTVGLSFSLGFSFLSAY